MNANRRLATQAVALTGMGLWPLAGSAKPDGFPHKPLRIIVPVTPGSGIDAASRFFGRQLEKALDQQVVVENLPGGNGLVAIAAMKRAPADGHTIMAVGAQLIMNPIVLKTLPYDPVKDFQPIAGMTKATFVIAVPANSPAKTLKDLVASGKTATDGLNAGSYSTAYELYTAWFGQLTGVKFRTIPYKGSAGLIADLVGGRLDFTLMESSTATPLVHAGSIRLLAVTSARRHPRYPQTPTVAESGYPEYVVYVPISLQVRAETPAPSIEALARTMQTVLATGEAEQFATAAGLELVTEGPVDLKKYELQQFKLLKGIADRIGLVAKGS